MFYALFLHRKKFINTCIYHIYIICVLNIYVYIYIYICLALLGYSSGSAGGAVLGERPELEPSPTPENTDVPEPPATPEQVLGTGELPAEGAPPDAPMVGEPESSASKLETELKERMYKHMAALEQQMTNDFMEKKRKAESDLEDELKLKREKRMRDLEEELKEERDLKETQLARLECQLAERMQLVSDEQALIDELKEKSHDLQKKLADEGAKLNSVPATPVQTPVLADKDRAKEMLKLKLQQTVERSRGEVPPQQTPSPSHSIESTSTGGALHGSGGSGQNGTPPSQEPKGVIIPATDMRFTSSTHPGAWHFLYRLTRREDQCDKTIYDQWHEGGKILYCTLLVCYRMTSNAAFNQSLFMTFQSWGGGVKRDKLLRDFVCRCYAPTQDFGTNKAFLWWNFWGASKLNFTNLYHCSSPVLGGQAHCFGDLAQHGEVLEEESSRIQLAHRRGDEVSAEMARVSQLINFLGNISSLYYSCNFFEFQHDKCCNCNLRPKVEGAIRFCSRRKLTKTDRYMFYHDLLRSHLVTINCTPVTL